MAETSLEAATRSLGARIDPVLELFDYLKDVLFWVKDKKGIFRWVNTTLMLHIGRSSRDQIIGRADFDLFEPYLANQYQMDDAQVLRGRPTAESWVKHPAATAAGTATRPATGSGSFLPVSDTFLLDRNPGGVEDTPEQERRIP